MTRAVRLVLLMFEAVLAAPTAYLALLSVLAPFAPRRTPLPPRPRHRFVVLIPAHNEAELLPGLLESISRLDYPRSLLEVHVVADNCTDDTPGIARRAGVNVHERRDPDHAGKGYALQWLLDQLRHPLASACICRDRSGPASHDAFLFLDADSVISANFLRVMDARLARGERAIQAYYAVRDPARSTSVALRAAALAALHYLRPQARTLMGGSAGLKGNGMVLVPELLENQPWSNALTEDIELHLRLILAGERVTFAPDAVVSAEMPETLSGALSQNVRWERGRLQMVRRYVMRLLRDGYERRSLVLVDAAVEQLIPPFSLVVGPTVLVALASAAAGSRAGARFGAVLLAAQAAYTIAALLLTRAPLAVYRALLSVPRFVLWKVGVYVGVLVGRRADQQRWVRTARNPS